MSSKRRTEAMDALNHEVRGWQADQELFDSVVSERAGINRTDWRCLDILGAHGAATESTKVAVTGVLGTHVDTTNEAIEAAAALALALALALGLRDRPAVLFALGIVALGAALGLFAELFAIEGDIGRMNTVFKFYLQAWVLLSIAAAVALGWLVRRVTRDALLQQMRLAWVTVLAIFVLAALAYP